MDLLRSLIGMFAVDFVRELSLRGIAAHANRTRPTEPPPNSVRYGWVERLIGLAMCAAMGMLSTIMALSIANGKPIEGASILAPFFGALAIWLGIECLPGLSRRIDFNESEVRFRKWNGVRIVAWKEIVGCEEKSHPPHIRITLRDGTGFAISETMKGSRYFIALVMARLSSPPESPKGHKRLRRRQKGKKS